MLRMLLTAALAACAALTAPAQAPPAVLAGAYRLNRNHEPEGGTRLFLFPNRTYAVVYFGGAESGRWDLEQDSLLFLTRTDLPARPFALYARHNPALGARARFFAGGGFQDAPSYVAFAGLTRPGSMQRVFNPDANCFSFPYVDTMAAIPDSISFVQERYDEETGRAAPGPTYTFSNRERYNDFVAGFYPEWTGSQHAAAVREPLAAVRPQGLYLFDADFVTPRGDLSLSADDSTFLAALQAQSPDPDTVLFNPRYKGFFPEPSAPGSGLEGYRYRPEKAAFVTSDYTEGAELDDAFDFNDLRILYPFQAIRHVTETRRALVPAPESVFTATCQ